jgi:DNA-directed RNA polymerase subunit RPC12/RpoP
MIYQPGPNVYRMMHSNHVLGVECASCRHRAVFTARQLIELSNVGEMAGLDYMARRMRCAHCGHKGVVATQIPLGEDDAWLAEAAR